MKFWSVAEVDSNSYCDGRSNAMYDDRNEGYSRQAAFEFRAL